MARILGSENRKEHGNFVDDVVASTAGYCGQGLHRTPH